jgi:hypothetical protein
MKNIKYLNIQLEEKELYITTIYNKIKISIFDLYFTLLNFFYNSFYFELFSIVMQNLQIFAFPLGISVKYFNNLFYF